MTMQGTIGGGKARGIRLDKLTNALLTVDYAHHEIHDGSHYHAVVSDQLASTGDHIDIGIGVPGWMPWQNDIFDTTYHILINAWSSAAYSIGIYEDVTSFSGGTVQTPVNSNRLVGTEGYPVDKTSDLDVTAGVIVRTGGTLLLPLRYYGSRSAGAEKRDDEEMILKAGSTYVITLTQTVNVASNCGIEIDWYETRQKD